MSRIPLVCAPFAGSGAAFFRPWRTLAHSDLEIVPVRLPGRERRIREQPYRDVRQAAEDLLPGLLTEIGGAGQVALFGHSLGAVLAYELGHLLAGTPSVTVVSLVVSGSPGPWTRRELRATGLPDSEFVARVGELAGHHDAALEDPEVRQMVLPTLRADVEMHENYRPGTDTPLAAPITAVRGRDDSLVSAEQAGEWAKATSREFVLRELPGEHMYLADSAAEVLRVVEESAGLS
ncbi:thioesterase II family protein [Amycolatopsis alba]|uniref:Thioesterase n=1 Tax=Amycolatopsis alba DSM 44262 TaxID=1125972 RepID=A0A229RF12_AMYAL|nr:alpha/beta fold hydrolase [Amycolatopsis alba]OXM45004.1 thioesterase [Amycolatopsis alba DSM 44262]